VQQKTSSCAELKGLHPAPPINQIAQEADIIYEKFKGVIIHL
jgi:hypothetical protein